jgi:hypothetical protein
VGGWRKIANKFQLLRNILGVL